MKRPNLTPLGQFRLQLVSLAAGAEVLALLQAVSTLASALNIPPNMKYWSHGKWNPYLGEDLSQAQLAHARMNQVVLFAESDSRAAKSLDVKAVSATFDPSPLNILWDETNNPAVAARNDGLRMTFNAREQYVRNKGWPAFPSILDILLFRSRRASERDREAFFRLLISTAKPVAEVLTSGCGDFDRQTNNALQNALLRGRTSEVLGGMIDDAHEMLIVESARGDKLMARLAGLVVDKETLSSKLIAISLRQASERRARGLK